MASAPAPTPLPLRARRRLVSARASALFVDTLLVAYTLWCANYLVAYAAGSLERDGWLLGNVGFLGPRPWLLLLTPLLAVLWQTTGASIGQRAYRVTVVDAAGEPADFDRRAWRGVLAAGEAALVLLPVALAVLARQSAESAGWSLPVLLSVVLMLGSGAFGLGDPLGRGVVDRLAGTHTVTLRPNASAIHRPWWKRGASWALLVVLLLTFAVGFLLTRFRPLELVTNIDRTANMWSRLLSPDWSIAARVAEKMIETVFLALMASALALPFAFALSFLGARNIMTGTTTGSIVYAATRILMNITRSIEPLVWAIIFILWVGVGPAAGMLALFVHSVAALGKLYSEAIESIDPGPVEAIQATGANALQVLRYGVVPQVIPPFLSFTIYRWDINVRMATILGLVGGGGIGTMLIEYQQMGAWSKVGTIIVFITLVVWAMDWASSKARQKLT